MGWFSRSGPKPDDPVTVVNEAGKVLADPDDPSRPLQVAASPAPTPTAASELPEVQALRNELAQERAERAREAQQRAAAEQQQKVAAIRQAADQFAASHAGRLLPPQQKAMADAHAALGYLATGLPAPQGFDARAALQGFQETVAGIPEHGLGAPAILPDGKLPANLTALPNGGGGKPDPEAAGRQAYEEHAAKQRGATPATAANGQH